MRPFMLLATVGFLMNMSNLGAVEPTQVDLDKVQPKEAVDHDTTLIDDTHKKKSKNKSGLIKRKKHPKSSP